MMMIMIIIVCPRKTFPQGSLVNESKDAEEKQKNEQSKRERERDAHVDSNTIYRRLRQMDCRSTSLQYRWIEFHCREEDAWHKID